MATGRVPAPSRDSAGPFQLFLVRADSLGMDGSASSRSTPSETNCLLGEYQQDEKAIAPRIIGLTLIGLIAVAVLLWLTLSAIDDISEREQQEWIRIALHAEKIQQQNALREYAHWNEAHQNLIQSLDKAWADANIGAYLTETYGIDLAVALSGDGRPTVAFINGELTRIPAGSPLIQSLTGPIVHAVGHENAAHIANIFLRLRNEVHLVSIAAFLDEKSKSRVGDGSVLVVAQKLDRPFFERLERTYRIAGLKRARQATETCTEAILNPDGQVLGYLCWQRRMLGSDYRNRLMFAVALVFVLMGLITLHILRLDRQNLRRHADHLRELASKDFLTNISNRREFFHLAGRELSRARREAVPLSLLMLDIDHFKRINDTYGHSNGDIVLRDLAGLTREHLREFDIFARVGGEEFAILLPNSPAQQAIETAERLRKLIGRTPFILGSGQRISFTVSIGHAQWDGSSDLDALIEKADSALYTAKRDGRNRCRSAPE